MEVEDAADAAEGLVGRVDFAGEEDPLEPPELDEELELSDIFDSRYHVDRPLHESSVYCRYHVDRPLHKSSV